MFRPKLFTCLKNYSVHQWFRDLQAGVIVGIVAVPLAIAFAIASGLSPACGLITAVVAGLSISAFGGSRVQIGGPTGAFVIIVAGIVSQYGVDGLLLATFLGGIILVIFGAVGLGGVIKFIPYPVTMGFTSGIAIIIASTQVKDFLGITIPEVPTEFIHKWLTYYQYTNTVNAHSLMLALLTILIILSLQRVSRKIPGSLVALVILTIASSVLKLPVETIGSRFGAIPNSLPLPQLPHWNMALIKDIMPTAFSIAMLAGIESLLSAVVADGMIGGKHRSNTELTAQGLANIFSALFGGMPATGAIARTATNVHNGGRTPIAGITHALVLVIIMYCCAHLVVYIPLAVLAGILMLVAYRMSEWRSFLMILRSPKHDVAVLLITFGLTVLVDLTVAIQIGIVLSAFLLLHRLSNTPNVSMITREITKSDIAGDTLDLSADDVPAGVEVYEIVGPFFFGVTSRFIDTMNDVEKKPMIRILRMRYVLDIDATAVNALRHVIKESKKNGVMLFFSGLHSQPLIALDKAGLLKKVGLEYTFPTVALALDSARRFVEEKGLHLNKKELVK